MAVTAPWSEDEPASDLTQPAPQNVETPGTIPAPLDGVGGGEETAALSSRSLARRLDETGDKTNRLRAAFGRACTVAGDEHQLEGDRLTAVSPSAPGEALVHGGVTRRVCRAHP